MKFYANTSTYETRKFVFLFKLNQRVKSASILAETPYYSNKKIEKRQRPLIIENHQPIKIYCSEPILAIKKRKVWLRQFLYNYKSDIRCIECKFYGYIFLYIE